MLDISGYEAQAIHFSRLGPRVQWSRADGASLMTDFDRFYPTAVGLGRSSGSLVVNWKDVSDKCIVDDFYDHLLRKSDDPDDRTFDLQTAWSDFLEIAGTADAVPLTGMIFHGARSGSTLVHRMINQVQSTFSLCEPRVIGSLFAENPAWTSVDEGEALKAVTRMLGRRANLGKTAYVIKLTDTLGLVIGRVRTLLPTIPLLFIYRDPYEILVSISAGPTGTVRQWIKDPVHAGLRLVRPALDGSEADSDEVAARVLGGVFKAVAESAASTQGSPLRVIDYTSLPGSFFSVVAPHFNIALSAEDREKAHDAARHYSKSKDQRAFVSDREEKSRRITPRIIDLVDRFVAPHAEQCKKLCVS